jgi:light-regulated signal transduction histidine kinase (bacteriophytochrome)
MGSPDQNSPDEIERLRAALEEETLARLAAQKQLDGANAGFEEFISLTAHDLRESLRGVTSCAELIAEQSGGHPDGETGTWLEHIQADAARMQLLLSDVVDYWAAGPGGRQLTRTDMEAVLRHAVLSNEQLIAARGANVTHDTLPCVIGDFEVLSRVLHHLLRNAIAYCDAPVPQIHISSMQEDSGCVISVRDNGAGIELAFQARIFEPFKRLHGKEHPGNGLGLAYCKKAIEGCGGRIWTQSAPGAGSTFFFTAPVAD